MSAFVLKDAESLFGGRNITGILNQIGLSYEAELKDSTVMQSNTRTRAAGLITSSITQQGFWDSAADSDFFNKIGALTEEVISIIPAGLVVGNRAFTMETFTATYNQGTDIGEVFPFTLELMSHGPLVKGLVEVAETVIIDGNSTGVQLGALNSTQTIHASMHITAASGNTPTLNVTVESDDNAGFTSPTTRMTFAQVTSNTTAEFISLKGPVTDNFWRIVWDINDDSAGSPSYTIFVILGII